MEAAWSSSDATLTWLGYDIGIRWVVSPMQDERPTIAAILGRMQEKLAARLAEGDVYTDRLRGDINLLQRTNITLDEAA